MNHRSLLCQCLLFSSAAAVAACSGVPDPGLGETGEAGALPASEVPPADAGADQTVSPTASSADAASPPARTPDAGAPVITLAEAGGQDAAGRLDGVAPRADARAPDALAPTGDGGPTFSCGGSARCGVSSETCCVEPDAAACVNGATCPGEAVAALHCAAAGDCPGAMVCCLTQNPPDSQCRAVCVNGDRELCDLAADGGCTNTQRCGPVNAGNLMRLPNDIGLCQ